MSFARISPKMESESIPRTVRSSDSGCLTNQSIVWWRTVFWKVSLYVFLPTCYLHTRTIHACQFQLTGVTPNTSDGVNPKQRSSSIIFMVLSLTTPTLSIEAEWLFCLFYIFFNQNVNHSKNISNVNYLYDYWRHKYITLISSVSNIFVVFILNYSVDSL